MMRFRRVLRAYSVIALSGLALIWFGYGPAGFDRSGLRSDAKVVVTERGGARTYSPRARASRAALLFLPGALVDPDAYAPMARAVAERGYPVTILPLPFRAALSSARTARVLGTAEALLRADTSRHRWVMAGHSRGGKLAAAFASRHPDLLAGLVLIGTTHPRADHDLSQSALPVTKVYGTRDGVAPPDVVLANRRYLPPATRWIRIEGGNHAQFAYYRYQIRDRPATISRAEQTRVVVQALCDALARAAAGPDRK